jgi:D-serine deaminase-like pyridoxal phosphate-dependent protein
MRISELPTPALVVDLDLMDSNIASLQSAASAAGKALRPHAKAHKRVEIAKRQLAAGAAGVCCATLSEVQSMAAAGISVLLTTPIASPAKAAQIASLPNVTVVIDHPFQLALFEAAGARCHALVDLDIGDHRTGIPCDERALALAQAIDNSPFLTFAGLQAYSVSGSHTAGHAARKAHSTAALAQAIDVQRELLRRGLNATRLTGGSTGTWDIDLAIPELTELQAGSYPLMDVAYNQIGGIPFALAMTAVATVISASHPGRVTVDAGFKAFATDRPFGPEAINVPGARWAWAGDEHGFLFADELPGIGQQVAFAVPHCDPTVNLHEKLYACREGEVVEVWTR